MRHGWGSPESSTPPPLPRSPGPSRLSRKQLKNQSNTKKNQSIPLVLCPLLTMYPGILPGSWSAPSSSVCLSSPHPINPELHSCLLLRNSHSRPRLPLSASYPSCGPNHNWVSALGQLTAVFPVRPSRPVRRGPCLCLRPYPQTPAGDGTEPLLRHSQGERIETQASNQRRGRHRGLS